MRKYVKLLLLLITAFLLTACEEAETVDVSKLDTMNLAGKTSQLEQILDVDGEDFKIVCTYDTGDYNLNDWRITDSKTLSMKVKTIDLPEGTEVLIEHVHSDINVKSTLAIVDGLQQDSMDDSYHGTSQDGFYIDNDTFYKNIFAIEGYSETLFNGWGYICGSYGTTTITEERLTEKNLIVYGKAYAQKMQVVYDISIKGENDNRYRTVSVVSEFLIPLNTQRYAEESKKE